jgi:TonB family protein
MKLAAAALFSVLVHLFAFSYFLMEYTSEIVETEQQNSIDAIDFSLGIVAVAVEDKVVKKVNSIQQTQTQAGVNNTITPVMPISQKKEPVKQEILKERLLPVAITKSQIIETEKNSTKIGNQINKTTPQIKKQPEQQQAPQYVKVIDKPKVVPAKTIDSVLPVKQSIAGGSTNSPESIKQKSELNEDKSTGGKAAKTASENTQSASYIAGLQRVIANSANKLYPQKAKRKNQQGVVKVGFYLLSDGTINNVAIIMESKYRALNKAAVKAVKRIKKYRPLPEGTNDYFVIPISFNIR